MNAVMPAALNTTSQFRCFVKFDRQSEVELADLPGVDAAEVCRVIPTEFPEEADLTTTYLRHYIVTERVLISELKLRSIWSRIRGCTPSPDSQFQKRHQAEIALRLLRAGKEQGVTTIGWTTGNILLVLHKQIAGFYIDGNSADALCVRSDLEALFSQIK